MKMKEWIFLKEATIFSLLIVVSFIFNDALADCNVDPDGTYIEAENYTGTLDHSDSVNDNFTQVADGNASGGIALRSGSGGSATSTPGKEIKTYNVTVTDAGTYYFWMRGEGYSGWQDSMFFTVDDVSWKAWNFGGTYNTYIWTKSMQVGSNGIYLGVGDHTIKIAMREDDTRIDGFFLSTNSSATPSFSNPLNPTTCQDTGTTLPVDDSTCGDIPLYTQNILNPAIMVQLDLSGSMDDQMYSNDRLLSSDISSVVQEIINQEDWTANNAMAFRVSGTGSRGVYSYKGDSANAPLLTIKYSLEGTETEISKRISSDADDVQMYDGSFKTDYYGLYFGDRGPVGLVFRDVNVPVGAEVVSAEILFKYRSSDDISKISSLLLEGFKGDNVTSVTSAMLQATSGFTSSSASINYTRLDYAGSVLSEIFKDDAIAWGFATWAGGNGTSGDTGVSSSYYTDYEVGVKAHTDVHQANLVSSVSGTDAAGWTPLTPSMNAAYSYFKGNRSDNEYSEKYVGASCQAKILVIVTDGKGNTGTTDTNVTPATNQLIGEKVSVVAVGFGLDNATQLNTIAKIAQSAGNVSEADKIYALHDEVSGDGVPFLANSPDEFLAAMKSIISSVKLQMYNGVAPAPTTSVKNDQVLVTATFNPTKWTGDVVANTFDGDTGVVGGVLWSASDVYSTNSPASTKCFIRTATDIENYTSTTLDNDNYMCKDLGDIINSTPKIVGTPAYFYDFDDYSLFKYNTTVAGRDSIVYVNSNDGALHAFLLDKGTARADADTTALGTELWRFYPESVTDRLDQDLCSDAYCHQYINDGSPAVADIYKAGITTGSKWRTILTSGIGQGGAGFYALDITYGADLDSTTNASSWLWEFDETDDVEVGQATAVPEIERVANSTGATWVTYFGSGRSVISSEQIDKQAYLFAVDSWSKAPVWKNSSDESIKKILIGTEDPDDSTLLLKNDIPSSPLVIDVDDDDKADTIYLGNRYGELFRIKNIGVGDSPSVGRLFKSGFTDHKSPIVAKPAFAYDSGDTLWVYAGTGKYEVTADKTTSDQQYVLGIKDEGSTTGEIDDLKSCTVASITSGGDEYRTVSCASGSGSWALNLMDPASSASERSLSQPLVVGGIVFFTTFVPDEDVCGGSGDAYLYALDWRTGDVSTEHIFTDYPQFVGETAVAGLYIGKGVPFQPVLHNDILFAGTTEEPPAPYKVNLKELEVALKAWKQEFN